VKYIFVKPDKHFNLSVEYQPHVPEGGTDRSSNRVKVDYPRNYKNANNSTTK